MYSNADATSLLESFGSNTISTTGNITVGNANLGNLAVANYYSGSGSLLSALPAANITGTLSVATSSSAANSAGYLGMPQNIKSTNYGIVIGDMGKHVYVSATSTVTVPANSNVAFPIGTTISVIAGSGATATIAITSDVMYLAGAGTTGSRTLAAFGMATLVKVATTTWFISGVGLT